MKEYRIVYSTIAWKHMTMILHAHSLYEAIQFIRSRQGKINVLEAERRCI